MSKWQKILLVVTAVVLVAVAVMTWGSVGSAVSMYCLIMMSSALLVQIFLTNRDSDDFEMEQ